MGSNRAYCAAFCTLVAMVLISSVAFLHRLDSLAPLQLVTPIQLGAKTHEFWDSIESRFRQSKGRQQNTSEAESEPLQNIVIITAADKKQDTNILQSIQNNRQEYADFHGYKHYIVDSVADEAGSIKLQAIRKAFNDNSDADWFWFLDSDALIMNEHIDLQSHLLNPSVLSQQVHDSANVENVEVIMAQDSTGWTTSSMFLKRSELTRVLLALWEDQVSQNSSGNTTDQLALAELAINHRYIYDRIGTVQQRLINSDYDVYFKGDLVAHFPEHVKQSNDYPELWQEMYNSRIRTPKRYRL